MQNVKWWLHNIFFKRTISLMVTCHVIYAQNIHQKLISTAQILTNNFQNTFCQKTFKHRIFKYWILQGNTDFDKQLPKHSLPKKNIQILDIVRKHRFFKQLPKHICQKNIQILDISRQHRFWHTTSETHLPKKHSNIGYCKGTHMFWQTTFKTHFAKHIQILDWIWHKL